MVAKYLTIWKHCLQSDFFEEINSDISFHDPGYSAASPSLQTTAPGTFLYRRVGVFPFHGLFFQFRKTHVSPICNICFTKTCFSVNITYSSVNFTWFALFSHQKFSNRPLFKPGAHIFIFHRLWESEVIFAINRFQIHISRKLVGWGCTIHRLQLCRRVRHFQRVSRIWHKTIWWWSSGPGALGKVEYPFIAIAPRFTLTMSSSTW